MTDSNGNQNVMTAEDYIRSITPNANISEIAIQGILADAGIAAGTTEPQLTEKQKDLAMAYLYIRIASSPLMSQKVTDRDGDWEHSEGSEQWSRSQLAQFLALARELLAKWDVKDPRVETLAPKWGMKGTGFRYIRKKP